MTLFDGYADFSDHSVQLDAGLLSPVRAGTPVEAAVCDRAWLGAMLEAEAALARAQARLGVVPKAAAETITAVAGGGELDLRAVALAARETANPVVALVRALTEAVAAQDPVAAEYVHRGSTSQDVFDTGAMLVARRALALIRADLGRTAEALGVLAARHRDTAMPGRTLVLHAVPTTFGLKAAGWRELVLAADRRLALVHDEGLPVSLGGAAGTLSGYLEFAHVDHPGDPDPEGYPVRLAAAFAEETGLAQPRLPWHTLRAPMADLAAATAFTTGALGKFAVDVQVLARTEIGEVAEPGPVGRGGSSAMPHKRNPVLAAMIRSAALQVPAFASVLTQSLLAEDERSGGGWQSEWLPLRECLRLAGGAAHTAAELAEGLTVHADRMAANLDLTRGAMVSERLAARLAPLLGKAAAKRLLTQASERAAATGRPLGDVLADAPELDGQIAPTDLAALCDPRTYTGAAATLVDRALRAEP
ncbi:3-carboxy-cis,cis-muconate cycloisomerase [Yinghuangia seranimata]|uniref:3-carboxy-cis,cis-muconate cycloisomerase n=1 Tax=Yinghuangia seranimata TaxID=408067 RepID=UPI00248C9E56|nr:3-carboxy-cis,cis-muconate cycloisomerase [Yinghuangia seranimata]MDI2130929.1 3-carboxy-cis,cis-muconate cycloisomerase [Yinghuangia seranimata]